MAAVQWQSLQKGDIVLTVISVECKKEQDRISDIKSPDFMKSYDVNKFSVVFGLAHCFVPVFEKIQKESRQPTSEEQKQLAVLPEGGVVAARRCELVMSDGSSLPAITDTVSGMHGPFNGYTYKAVVKTTNVALTVKEISMTWLEKYRRFEIPLKIENVKL